MQIPSLNTQTHTCCQQAHELGHQLLLLWVHALLPHAPLSAQGRACPRTARARRALGVFSQTVLERLYQPLRQLAARRLPRHARLARRRRRRCAPQREEGKHSCALPGPPVAPRRGVSVPPVPSACRGAHRRPASGRA